jgi:hypothetical protein
MVFTVEYGFMKQRMNNNLKHVLSQIGFAVSHHKQQCILVIA